MNQKITEKKIVLYFLVALCALLWGFSFFGTTVVLEKLAPIQVLTIRWTISAVIFLFLAALKIIKINLRGKDLKRLLLMGMLQPSLYSIFETNGINLTTTSESSIIIATIPLFVLIIGMVFLHKRYSIKVVIAILVAFTGVVICIVFSPNFSLGGKGVGYIVLVGAVLTGAIYCYASNYASEQFTSVEITFEISIVGAVFFNIINLSLGYGVNGFFICLSDYKLLMAMIFLGVGCSCICYLIFNYVLGVLPTAIASNIVANSTTAIGVITGVIFAGDPFGWFTIVGLILTLSGIIISSKASQ